ncbi:MAG: DUF2997 domain-containing protein [Akkermansiaceae bacterium]|nr:DUF2997 domain-containing protein [Akkermansiaceae bacterium]
MSRRILVKVSPTGGITVDAEGFQGKGCTDATKAIEEALGSRTARTLKPEFQRKVASQPLHQQLGNGGGEP